MNRAIKIAQTWNRADETIEEVSKRMHDSVEDLVGRADNRVANMARLYPEALTARDGFTALEIGGGIGYIMEALGRHLTAQGTENWRITDLDIAENMIAKARTRLTDPRFSFTHYDGLNVPLPDNSFDLVYSIASLQHVPKEYVYHLFSEIRRLLKPDGRAVLHLLSMKHLQHVINHGRSWETFVQRQIDPGVAPSLHLYSIDEVRICLEVGVGASDVEIKELLTALYVKFGK